MCVKNIPSHHYQHPIEKWIFPRLFSSDKMTFKIIYIWPFDTLSSLRIETAAIISFLVMNPFLSESYFINSSRISSCKDSVGQLNVEVWDVIHPPRPWGNSTVFQTQKSQWIHSCPCRPSWSELLPRQPPCYLPPVPSFILYCGSLSLSPFRSR